MRNMTIIILLLLSALFARTAAAVDVTVINRLASGDSEEKIGAIAQLAREAPEEALPVLKALAEDALYLAGDRLVTVDGDTVRDASSGAAITPAPSGREPITINNRVRREVAATISSLNLFATDKDTRFNAAKALAEKAAPESLALIEKALAKESDPEVQKRLGVARNKAALGSPSAEVRLEAVRELGSDAGPDTRQLLAGLLVSKGDAWAEPDANVRAAAAASLKSIDRRLTLGETLGSIFTGISLGSLLLLAAMGLAITYGVMGVINMAHGELLMIGAYSAFAVQSLFRAWLPGWVDWYLVAALPVGFSASALVGIFLERIVIRHLYGRPLETLLATWGISLFLIQAVRTFFGAQNVEVANPTWMSGGIEVLPNLMLPWNRVIIIGFAVAVLSGMWAILNMTRLGLFIRAVTQNRPMSGCVGVSTGLIDSLAFGLGAGIAGLGGVALSQVSNVGPDMGQGYIVDSFMVVVLGGVGQLAGTVLAAFGLGEVSKFLEGWSGAVIAKIVVLVFIIVFIQKRPQGLFALKGRTVES